MSAGLGIAGTATRSVLVGLVGQGIGPSLTPEMHEREGARHGMRYVYRRLELGPDPSPTAVAELVAAARTCGFDGLNVTHPAKQTVLELVDELSPAARAVGAVNTLTFGGGTVRGDNTDVTGFGYALDHSLPTVRREQVVLIGAGGAGAAVAHALLERGVSRLTVVDADPVRATRLAASLDATSVDVAGPEAVAALMATADGIVNATPMGMAQHPGSPIDTDLLDPRHWVADVVYRPVRTTFVEAARARGCEVMTGLGMAAHQAADAFEIFTGVTADRDAITNDLLDLVSREENTDAADAARERNA